MILDANLAFATSTSPYQVPNSASTTSIGPGTGSNVNVIDLGLSGLPASTSGGGGGGARDIALGDQFGYPKVVVNVTGAFSSAGTTTAQILIQGAQDNGTGQPGSFTTFAWGPTLTTVSAATVQPAGAAGAMWVWDLQPVLDNFNLPRFLQMQIVTTGTGTNNPATTLAAWLTLDTISQVRSSVVAAAGAMSGYPAGITVAN